MSKIHDGASYPEPFIVHSRKEHKHSLILLHGRGSNGERFGTEFLTSQSTLKSPGIGGESGSAVFASALSNFKFIFPTARKRRARWYNRASINQWFDGVPINEQDAGVSAEEEGWQLEGLRQSRAFLKSIVDEEVNLVGSANVFIGGLSQGCAMSIHLLLSCEESRPLGGFVGMSGWLPFADAIEAIAHPKTPREVQSGGDVDDDDDDDPFAASSDEGSGFEEERTSQDDPDVGPTSKAGKICNFVRDNMDLPTSSSSLEPPWLSTPVFLGHGKSDEKVKIAKGLRVFNCLRDLGLQVTWREYDEGHWYKVPEETDDISKFLQACLEGQQD